MADLEKFARLDRLTVEEWVRRVLREARSRQPVRNSEDKLKAIRRAAQYSFPTADVDQMLKEIERGYLG